MADSAAMSDGPDSYHPPKRIRAACTECRRQKIRCTGERPTCQRCSRLEKSCQYASASNKAGHSGLVSAPALPDSPGRTHQGDILERLTTIERLLATLQSDMSALTSHVRTSWVQPSTHSRPLGSDNSLPPADVLQDSIDDFFRYSHNQQYCFFHEASFREQFAAGLVHNYLILAILATAVRFSSNPYYSDPHSSAAEYANMAWKAIVSTHLAQNQVATHLQAVQAITLLAIYDFTAGIKRHSSAWVKIGLSVRMAQDLKLMMDEPPGALPPAALEERRRVFWSIYLLDRIVSCGRGRPPAVLDASCQLQLPCAEHIWRSGQLQEPTMTLEDFFSHMPIPRSVSESTVAHVVVVAHTLSRTAGYMLQHFDSGARRHDPPWDARSDFGSIESDLLYIESSLLYSSTAKTVITRFRDGPRDGAHDTFTHGIGDSPCQASAGPGIFALVVFHTCFCLLHHPFLLRRRTSSFGMAVPRSFLSRTFASAWEHARAIIETVQESRNLGLNMHASFYGYCLVVAGSIMGLEIAYRGQCSRASTSARLQSECVAATQHIGQYWGNVSVMACNLQSFSATCREGTGFRYVACPEAQDDMLSLKQQETLWSLVDYSTMSNKSRGHGGKRSRSTYEHDEGSLPNDDGDEMLGYWEEPDSSWIDMFLNLSAQG